MAGESEHIKNRLRCHSPVYPMKQLTQKLTKTTVYWTGGRTEQQEAEEGLSIGNIKVGLSSMKTIFFTVTKKRERKRWKNHLPTFLLWHGHVLKSVCWLSGNLRT